jgi:hypothetical protein
MSIDKKRIYNSESRLVQAAQTRSRILMVAKNLFQTEGFELVTIEKLAKGANVSAPTIYSLFKSKRGVLRALMDEALPPEQYQALVEASKKMPAIESLKIAAKIARKMYDAERVQMDVFRGAEVLAPEFKEFEEEREARRYKRLEASAKKIVKEKVLLKGLTLKKAHDILWAFTGRDMYRMFVIDRGWASDEYEQWLAQLLIKMLLS